MYPHVTKPVLKDRTVPQAAMDVYFRAYVKEEIGSTNQTEVRTW